MRKLARVVLVLAGVGVGVFFACSTPNPRDCSDGNCTDPNYPFCDLDGSLNGSANTCISVSCTPSQLKECRSNQAIVCNADGNNYDVQSCQRGCVEGLGCAECAPGTASCSGSALQLCNGSGFQESSPCNLGCQAQPAPHCAYLEAKYLPEVCATRSTTLRFDVTTDLTIDTTSDVSCTGGVIHQANAPDVCVVHAVDISVAAGKKLTVIGSRLFALVADNTLTMDGLIVGAATSTTNGPGGGSIISGTGDGGAGFSTFGGAGGDGTTAGGANNGGAAINLDTQTAFIGGPRASDGAVVLAGGGGGGVTLIACEDLLSVTGSIDVHGGGGKGGSGTLLGNFPGGGGGAGGNLVLQGYKISINGKLYSNGGGGGAGCSSFVSTGGCANGASGADGIPGLIAAAGGARGTGAHNGVGGPGAVLNYLPGVGGPPTDTTSGSTPGGGGGSMGFIQVFVGPGSGTVAPTEASPKLQTTKPILVK